MPTGWRPLGFEVGATVTVPWADVGNPKHGRTVTKGSWRRAEQYAGTDLRAGRPAMDVATLILHHREESTPLQILCRRTLSIQGRK